jgi:hypothetical protein
VRDASEAEAKADAEIEQLGAETLKSLSNLIKHGDK